MSDALPQMSIGFALIQRISDLNHTEYLQQNIFDRTRLPKDDQHDADQDVQYHSMIYRTSYPTNDASLRELVFAMNSRSDEFEKDSYYATLPTQFSAIALYQFSGYNKSNYADGLRVSNFSGPVWSVAMPQAVVQADCLIMISTGDGDSPVPFVRDDGSTGSLFTLAELVSRIKAGGGLNTTFDYQGSSITPLYPPVWSNSPEVGSSSLVGVFAEATMAVLPGSNFSMVDIYNETQTDFIKDASLEVEICTFRSYWESAVISFDSRLLVMKSNLSQHFADPVRDKLQPIALHLAPDSILRTAKFIGDLDWDTGPVKICALLAVGLAEMPPWFVSETKDKNFQTPFKFTQTLTGYGYGHSTNSDILSATIITAYCIATIAYITYTIFTGSVSTAWNSPIELVILALQSRSVDHLGHTSVGIDSMHTFQESVGIRVNEHNALELVFAHSRDMEMKGLRKIERNKEY